MWGFVILILAVIGSSIQASTGCKGCGRMGKEERAMFLAHSGACAAESGVAPRRLEQLLAGQLVEDEALKRHVYCVLLKCKIVGKDGKLLKAALLGKLAARPELKNVTKVLETCSEQSGDTPEELAWKLFRCGYDKKAVLFDYMPQDKKEQQS